MRIPSECKRTQEIVSSRLYAIFQTPPTFEEGHVVEISNSMAPRDSVVMPMCRVPSRTPGTSKFPSFNGSTEYPNRSTTPCVCLFGALGVVTSSIVLVALRTSMPSSRRSTSLQRSQDFQPTRPQNLLFNSSVLRNICMYLDQVLNRLALTR
jgi:hypothetical protein